ncbi:hypothetical protein SAMN05660226_04143 [Parapedobacter luteus]|uniref:O-antigen ligase like membrane protein n=1 Tax=Parapedobacter luteus TaxID=623280 RepID=A0A1T5FQK5_9SPHI|nr:hypothetical protein [Parapedobacter luteus]SKB98433.1 hypothetical protein SAMN05660226_04143 [Parapedobacter luteus]
MDSQTHTFQQTWTSKRAAKELERTVLLLKRGIWLYFILLIFEGALRKWFLPALATPLLIVRDPIALALLAIAYHKGLFPRNGLMVAFIITGIISFFLTLLVGHGNLFVAIYGIRILIIHVPFMFLIGKVFRQQDVVEIGKAMLWIAIPMTVLVALQFYSPQSAWVNRGIGGDMEGAGFSGALGYARPPGTFSFTTGTTLFYSMLTPFILYFWLQKDKAPPLLILVAASIGLLAAIPLSISRGLLFQIALSFVFTTFIIAKRPALIKSLIAGLVSFALLLIALSNLSFFQTATEVFMTRFERANEAEGGLEGVLIDRFLGGMYSAVFGDRGIPLWGFGLGMGTNAGAMLLSGRITFLISEGEWGRVIGEMGFLLGMTIIVSRIVTATQIGLKSYYSLASNNILPWLLFSFAALNLLQGQWAQPTSLGFAIVAGGLTMAALKNKTIKNKITNER